MCLQHGLPTYFKSLIALLSSVKSKWAVTGSACLFLQGVDVRFSDVDILTTKQGVREIYALLKHYAISSPKTERISKLASGRRDEMRSYIARFVIAGKKTDVFSDFAYFKKGQWIKPLSLKKIVFIPFKGVEIPVIPLNTELAAYAKTGRKDRILLVKRFAPTEKN